MDVQPMPLLHPTVPAPAPGAATQWRVLAWDFHFHALGEDRWIAFEPALGCALRVNRRARDLIECLRNSVSLDGAFHGFARRQPTTDLARFAADIDHLTRMVESARGRARRRLTWGMTLVPHRLFSRWSAAFAGLVRAPVLCCNVLVLIGVLVAAFAGEPATQQAGGWLLDGAAGLLMIASVFAHELGHGAALRRFGHPTGAMGVGIFLIYPVFYVEMLTLEALPRRGRLWVDVGGTHLQVAFGHLVALAGFVLQAPWLVSLAVGIYVLAAFQLLPVNQSDGYWLLLDMLDGVVSPRHVRWTRYACHTVAGGLFAGVLALALRHLWTGFASGMPLTWRSITVADLVSVAQVALLAILLIRFLFRHRRTGMGHLARP